MAGLFLRLRITAGRRDQMRMCAQSSIDPLVGC